VLECKLSLFMKQLCFRKLQAHILIHLYEGLLFVGPFDDNYLMGLSCSLSTFLHHLHRSLFGIPYEALQIASHSKRAPLAIAQL
jgi:hypothetical protein